MKFFTGAALNVLLALAAGPALAQGEVHEGEFSPVKEARPSSGDLYRGLTRALAHDRVIPPYGIEVTFDKTTHIIFPAAITYVDLGSASIVAGKAAGAENILRVKAALRDFPAETNFSVVTDEGSFYAFNVKYADEPGKLNIQMKDFIHDGQAVNRPDNTQEVYLSQLGKESPRLVRLIIRSVYESDKRNYTHIGDRKFGIQFTLKGIYAHQGMLYLHTQIKNATDIPYDIDFLRIKVVDRKIIGRTAIQETVVTPLRAYNHVTRVDGRREERTVFAIPKITIPDGKQLVVELYERDGGRNLSFAIGNEELVRARPVDKLKTR